MPSVASVGTSRPRAPTAGTGREGARVTLTRLVGSSARRTESEVRRASVSTAGSVLPLRDTQTPGHT